MDRYISVVYIYYNIINNLNVQNTYIQLILTGDSICENGICYMPINISWTQPKYLPDYYKATIKSNIGDIIDTKNVSSLSYFHCSFNQNHIQLNQITFIFSHL